MILTWLNNIEALLKESLAPDMRASDADQKVREALQYVTDIKNLFSLFKK